MKAGYFYPFSGPYRLAWMWWVILLSFQQVLFFEYNMVLNRITLSLFGAVLLGLYFLARRRRFFIVEEQIQLSRDFHLSTYPIDLKYISAVKVKTWSITFVYVGKEYRVLVFGKSKLLIQNLINQKTQLQH